MINVTKTYLPNKERYLQYVDKIFESGWLTNNGVFVQELEKRLKEYLGVENLIVVANGTLALQIAYHVLNIRDSEVITTPFSFVATTSSLVWEKIKPVFVDIESSSLTIDTSLLEKSITERTSAILPVHVFGNSCEVEKIQDIADKYNLKVIYDAAHAFGIEYKHESILNYGDASILSFHSTKVFHTIEGGAIIFKNSADCDRARLAINFGIPGYDKVTQLGINCKMNEFQAAMGLCLLDELDIIFNSRKKVWDKYLNAFSNNKNVRLIRMNVNSNNNYSYFPVIFNSESILMNIISILNKHEIFPRRYFYPSLDTIPYLDCKLKYPVSNQISERILCLPLYHDLPVETQDLIIEIINYNTSRI